VTARIVLALLGCAAAAGCGGEAGDLMAIKVSGGPVGARGPLDIVVASDGRGTCNDRAGESIPSDLVIDARELERDLGDLAEEGATFGPTRKGQREYVVRIKAGTVRWAEGERGLPEVLPRTQLLTLRLDRLLCRP
jgi:hypothetical protein